MKNRLHLWTDGSANPNPGPGGWAVVSQASHIVILSGNAKHTTNIRMEGYAIGAAIKFASERGHPVTVHTDSQFWINVLEKWAPTWASHNWTKRNGKIENLDLVQKLYEIYMSNDVQLVWVRGHTGTELNELADEAAKAARESL